MQLKKWIYIVQISLGNRTAVDKPVFMKFKEFIELEISEISLSKIGHIKSFLKERKHK